jgi:two-component system, LytTR family, response regulator
MRKPIQALVVDDERLARKDLTSLLAAHRDLRVVGEAQDVPSALEAIERLNPDVVFLDIQMPGQSGFDLLDQCDYKGKLIFVTAYDEYALRAFEVNALDYLLKPVSPERLKRAVERMEREEPAEGDGTPKLNVEDRLFLTVGNRLRFLRVGNILCIHSAGDYSEVVTTDGQKGLTPKPLKEWEQRLPGHSFCRIHRSTIIQMDQVERVEEWFNYSFRVHLRGLENPLVISRRYASLIKHRFV